MNNAHCRQSAVDCNVFFEQVLFAVLADKENREVASVLGRPMRDEGYTGKEFCDLLHFHDHPFFHVLGGHKRNQGICNSLERAMQKMHDNVFWPIINLFPDKNWRLAEERKPVPQPASVERCIAQYEDILENTRQEWKDIPADELHAFERKMVCQPKLMEMKEEELCNVSIKRNDYLNLFSFPRSWNPKAIELLHKKLKAKKKWWSFGIAITPSLTGYGLRETPVANLGLNVLKVLQHGVKGIDELIEQLDVCFTNSQSINTDERRRLILNELDYLIFYGTIEINNI